MHAAIQLTHSQTAPDIRPGSLSAWSIAMRPKTLWIATIPVLVGSSLAFAATRSIDLPVMLLALAASVLIQVISNLQNDVGYTARGIDSAQRVGLPRATARGWLSPEAVRNVIRVAIVITLLLGWPLVLRGGWPVMAMGIASILGALSYMGGPRPLAFTPFGELAVFVFFGLVAVAGSAYVQLGYVPGPAWLGAIAVGMHAAAVLAVNNYRDTEHDRATGRATFAVRFGRPASTRLYAGLIATPFVLAIGIAAAAASPWFALPLFAAPRAFGLVRVFRDASPGPALNELLFRTVMLEVAFGMLLTLGGIVTGLR